MHILVLQEPQKSGGQEAQALGRSRGGFSTKIHASVDALGNPLRFLLTGGQRHDITKADDLIRDFDFERVIAGRKIKHDRRIFSRFEKLDKRLLGFLCFASALVWLR